MTLKLQEIKWNLHNYKSRQLLLWGLKNGYIAPYDDKFIKKLRNIYIGVFLHQYYYYLMVCQMVFAMTEHYLCLEHF